jgi:hypothetical protein
VFKQRWTSLIGDDFLLIDYDIQQKFTIFIGVVGCSVDERFGVVISTRWTIT